MDLTRSLTVLPIVTLGFICQTNIPSTAYAESNGASVERGRYLVTISGCHDCHTPKVFGPKGPELDQSRLLSGHPASEKVPSYPADLIAPQKWGAVTSNGFTAWAGPWGISFSSNLTPAASGIGGWTEDVFIKTIRTGKHLGTGRDILPPMPWPSFAKMKDEDLKAIFAYLKSLPAVENIPPQPVPLK